MPIVDDFSRAQAMPAARPSTSDVVAAARRARAAALRGWMAAAWRMLVRRRRETKFKNREDLPMRRRHYEAYVLPHQID